MQKIEKWVCDYCNKVFDTWRECYNHEPSCPENKCLKCDHGYYTYDGFTCERDVQGKRCSFKQRKDDK